MTANVLTAAHRFAAMWQNATQGDDLFSLDDMAEYFAERTALGVPGDLRSFLPSPYTPGTTDARSAVVAAVTAVGTTGGIVISAGRHRVATNLDLSAGAHQVGSVAFQPGGVLVPDAGVTVTLPGSIVAGVYQLFDCSASGARIQFATAPDRVYPHWFGATGDGTHLDRPAFLAALDAASPSAGVVTVLPGTYDMGAGLSLSGYAATLLGSGTKDCVLKASAPAGYVIDLAGWLGNVNNNQHQVPFGGFRIQGAGVADATKAHGGLSAVGVAGILFDDIGVQDTGGPAFRVGQIWWCNTRGVVLNRPVGANTNDVEYFLADDWMNGCDFSNLKFRSIVATPDGSAVLRIALGSSTSDQSRFTALSFEFMHTPENGSIIDANASGYVFADIQTFDCSSAVDNPTNNCVVRLRAANGSTVRGVIPGRGTELNAIAYGVILEGDRNRVTGLRGYQANNVLLQAGSGYNYVELGGQVSGLEDEDAVVDNSGVATNVLLDHTTGKWTVRGLFKSLGVNAFERRFQMLQGLEVRSRYLGEVGFTAKAITGQTADVAQFVTDTDALLLGVGPAGEVKTNQTATATTIASPGAVAGKFPVYNTSGTLIGYVPLYASIT